MPTKSPIFTPFTGDAGDDFVTLPPNATGDDRYFLVLVVGPDYQLVPRNLCYDGMLLVQSN